MKLLPICNVLSYSREVFLSYSREVFVSLAVPSYLAEGYSRALVFCNAGA